MSGQLRVIKVGFGLVLTGISGVIVRALMAPSEPPPRWDLFLFILVALVGAIGSYVALLLGRCAEGGVDMGGRYWWPEQRSAWFGFGLFLIVIPVFLVFYATTSYSADARRIAELDYSISPAQVDKVLSFEHSQNRRTGNSAYASEIEASIPFSDGPRNIVGKVYSDEPMRPGDTVWALYAPSSSSLGAVLDTNRSVLQEKVGGSAGAPLIFLVVGWAAWWLFLAWLCGRSGSSFPALKAGRARSLEVIVRGGGSARVSASGKAAVSRRPSPCLFLSVGGNRQMLFFMDRAIDPVALGSAITGEALLYWAPPLRSGQHNTTKRQAVLIVPGDRYVRGWVDETPDYPLPEGLLVPASKDIPGNRPRAIVTKPIWEPSIHGVGFVALQIALLALLMMTLNIGTAGMVLAAIVALLALPAAWMVTANRRTRRLTQFLTEIRLS